MTDPLEQGLPRAVAMAWGIAANPQRGPKRELTHEGIVEAAITIADAEGLGAVTMSKVAASLGFTTMSLYRYVTSKDDLLTLMADAAAELSPAEDGWDADWRTNLWTWAALLRGVYHDHQWLLELPRTPTMLMTPNHLKVVDLGLWALHPAGMTDGEKMAAIMLISGYVRSFCELERDMASGQVELSSEPWAGAGVVAALQELVTPDRFPHLTDLIQSGEYFGTSESEPKDLDFRFGLDRLLDGFTRYLDQLGDRDLQAPETIEPPKIPEQARDEVRRDKGVRAAAAKRRDAEVKRRDAEIKVREAIKREQESIAKAVEKAARQKGE